MIDVTRRGGKIGTRSGGKRGTRSGVKKGTRSGVRRGGKIMVLHLLGSTEVRPALSAFDHIHILLLNLAAKSYEGCHAYISPV